MSKTFRKLIRKPLHIRLKWRDRVHTIFNGEFNIRTRDWNLREIDDLKVVLLFPGRGTQEEGGGERRHRIWVCEGNERYQHSVQRACQQISWGVHFDLMLRSGSHFVIEVESLSKVLVTLARKQTNLCNSQWVGVRRWCNVCSGVRHEQLKCSCRLCTCPTPNKVFLAQRRPWLFAAAQKPCTKRKSVLDWYGLYSMRGLYFGASWQRKSHKCEEEAASCLELLLLGNMFCRWRPKP